MTIKVSKQFLKDFAQLCNHFNWTLEEIEEFKVVIRENPEMKRYLEILAAAMRAGYVQTEENIHVRLKEWCLAQGLDDPFHPYFEIESFNKLKEIFK